MARIRNPDAPRSIFLSRWPAQRGRGRSPRRALVHGRDLYLPRSKVCPSCLLHVAMRRRTCMHAMARASVPVCPCPCPCPYARARVHACFVCMCVQVLCVSPHTDGYDMMRVRVCVHWHSQRGFDHIAPPRLQMGGLLFRKLPRKVPPEGRSYDLVGSRLRSGDFSRPRIAAAH